MANSPATRRLFARVLRRIFLTVAAIVLICGSHVVAGPISAFHDMPGGVFLDLAQNPSSNAPLGMTVDVNGTDVVLSSSVDRSPYDPTAPAFFGSYFSPAFFNMMPNDPLVNPGNYEGWFKSGGTYSHENSEVTKRPVILDFDVPLTGFGISFTDSTLGGGLPFAGTAGVTLSFYDGVNGTGNLLGTAYKPPHDLYGTEFPLAPADVYGYVTFRGFVTAAPQILSVIVAADGPYGGLFIDGFAFSTESITTPVPEPGSIALLLSGVGAAIIRRRRNKKNAALLDNAFRSKS